jgi:hypothetical protein
MPVDADIDCPRQDRVAGEFGAIVADDCRGLASRDDQEIELARDPDAGKRDVRDRCQALSGAIVIDGENAEAPTADELVGDEIQRPTVVRLRR